MSNEMRLVRVGELTDPMVRGYILEIANHLNPGGNIDKMSRVV